MRSDVDLRFNWILQKKRIIQRCRGVKIVKKFFEILGPDVYRNNIHYETNVNMLQLRSSEISHYLLTNGYQNLPGHITKYDNLHSCYREKPGPWKYQTEFWVYCYEWVQNIFFSSASFPNVAPSYEYSDKYFVFQCPIFKCQNISSSLNITLNNLSSSALF